MATNSNGTTVMPDLGGSLSTQAIADINANFAECITTQGGQEVLGALTVEGLLAALANVTVGGTLVVTGAVTLPGVTTPAVQTAAGATDAVTFASPINICVFTSTGPDNATLATPGAGDVGKILILVNTNTTQNVVTAAANKILNGTASTYDTLTAPAHAGAVAVLLASNGFWNVLVGGTGTWVLSEV